MNKVKWNLEKDLIALRKEFPILAKCVYLISNSMGAVPRQVRDDIVLFYDHWSDKGVMAWSEEWWDLARNVGDQLANLLHAEKDSITMMPNATHAHWVALSTKFLSKDRARTKIIMTDSDFPSSLYAVQKISEFMGWNVQIVQSYGKAGIDVENIIDHIDEQTLFVATSHVYFKSAYIQDVSKIANRSRRLGAWTVIDGYHAPGCIPVDLTELDVDFYIGGCLKWLCGGPGNAFLYVKPELASRIQPQLTGWLAHDSPFSFSTDMAYTRGSYRFMSGTPSIPSMYAARAGLDLIGNIGIPQIRQKSIAQTKLIIESSKKRNFAIFSPEEDNKRGGAVSVHLPHAYPVKQALDERKFKVDFRKGINSEPDVIRIGPHFYTREDEINALFDMIDTIYRTEEYRLYSEQIKHVT